MVSVFDSSCSVSLVRGTARASSPIAESVGEPLWEPSKRYFMGTRGTLTLWVQPLSAGAPASRRFAPRLAEQHAARWYPARAAAAALIMPARVVNDEATLFAKLDVFAILFFNSVLSSRFENAPHFRAARHGATARVTRFGPGRSAPYRASAGRVSRGGVRIRGLRVDWCVRTSTNDGKMNEDLKLQLLRKLQVFLSA